MASKEYFEKMISVPVKPDGFELSRVGVHIPCKGQLLKGDQLLRCFRFLTVGKWESHSVLID